MTAAELKEIVDRHGKWRRGEIGGSRANLARAYLAGADLADANLARAYLADANLADANLARADLADANLAGAYLAGADLAGADLARAYLARADLADANLAGANLAGANLADANLADANLARADLADANLARANLAGADLAGADLARANLARADLADANLAGAKNVPADLAARTDPSTPYVRGATVDYAARAAAYRERHPETPVVEQLDARILDAITVGGGKLSMGSWHQCKTTHCRAGWAITLAGEKGAALEAAHGPERAGREIYRASTGRVPHFYASDDQALADIKACAATQSNEAGK